MDEAGRTEIEVRRMTVKTFGGGRKGRHDLQIAEEDRQVRRCGDESAWKDCWRL
jgi:hypothetical protein